MENQRKITRTRFVLNVHVERVDYVEVSQGYGSTKSPSVTEREVHEVARYVITELELPDVLAKGAKLLALTGE